MLLPPSMICMLLRQMRHTVLRQWLLQSMYVRQQGPIIHTEKEGTTGVEAGRREGEAINAKIYPAAALNAAVPGIPSASCKTAGHLVDYPTCS